MVSFNLLYTQDWMNHGCGFGWGVALAFFDAGEGFAGVLRGCAFCESSRHLAAKTLMRGWLLATARRSREDALVPMPIRSLEALSRTSAELSSSLAIRATFLSRSSSLGPGPWAP